MKTLIKPKSKETVETPQGGAVNPTSKKDNSAIIWLVILLVVAVASFMIYNYINNQTSKNADKL